MNDGKVGGANSLAVVLQMTAGLDFVFTFSPGSHFGGVACALKAKSLKRRQRYSALSVLAFVGEPFDRPKCFGSA
jgi:hypothetical protein